MWCPSLHDAIEATGCRTTKHHAAYCWPAHIGDKGPSGGIFGSVGDVIVLQAPSLELPTLIVVSECLRVKFYENCWSPRCCKTFALRRVDPTIVVG